MQTITIERATSATVDAIFQPHIRFFVARLDGAAAGCDRQLDAICCSYGAAGAPP